jgi:hypothetical protein
MKNKKKPKTETMISYKTIEIITKQSCYKIIFIFMRTVVDET